MATLLNLAARLLLAQIFLLSGIGKISAYASTQAYMAAAGVPGILLPLVIILEIGGALALILGFQTRLVALLMAGFSLATGLLFHTHFADPTQQIMFMKNLAIAGGFLLLVQHGASAPSLDERLHRQGQEI